MIRKYFLNVIWGMCLILAACNTNTGSPQPTAISATTTPPSFTPTVAPASTLVAPASTLAPSLTSEPDAKATIAREELGLSDKFYALPPSDANIQEGANAFSLNAPDGSILQYTIAGSFIYSDSESSPTQVIWGYTALLPSSTDTAAFDKFTQSGMNDYFVNLFGVPAESVSPLAITNDFADSAGGTTMKIDDNGTPWQISLVAFRVGGIGSFVFVRNRSDDKSPTSVELVARAYAKSIQRPAK